MQPDSFASPSDAPTGMYRTVTTMARGTEFAPATASTAFAPGDPDVQAPSAGVGVVQGTGPSTAATPGMNGHSAVQASTNGAVHANGHWSAPIAAAFGNGAVLATATVMAEPLRDRGPYLQAGKRVIDFAGAIVALVLCAPLMLLAALAIRLESRGPIFYRSTRIGRRGRPFTFLKLRSMVNGADRARHHVAHLNEADGPVFKITNDPRVTRVGRFLRVTSIDEIPQFLNVLRGEMSLVGPRPPLPQEVAQYEPWQMRRLSVRPGLTCLWQISGRSRIGFQEWMRLDLEYIKHRSFLLDVKILLRTIPAVLSRDGAY